MGFESPGNLKFARAFWHFVGLFLRCIAVTTTHHVDQAQCKNEGDGDDEDELSDTIVDAYAVLGDDGPLWVLTPKPGRPGAASSSTVQSAAKTAGMNAATPLTVSGDWNGIRLRAFGKGR